MDLNISYTIHAMGFRRVSIASQSDLQSPLRSVQIAYSIWRTATYYVFRCNYDVFEDPPI